MKQEVVTSSAKNYFARYSHVESELIIDGCQPNLQPDLSVMIPTFRRPHLLKEAIESIINQTALGIKIEIVVVDNDAETDSSELSKLVESFFPNNIRLFKNTENIGMFGNWNRCIELAKAPIITILNDDDLLHPDFIRFTYESNIEAVRIVTHKTFSTLSNIRWEGINNEISLFPISKYHFFIGNPAPGSLGVLMNKRCALKLGGYNEDVWPTSDYDFTYRYWRTYGGYKTKLNLSGYRWAENESLKVDTLTGFLKYCYQFRLELISSLSISNRRKNFLMKINNLKSVNDAFIYNSVNSEFNVQENLMSIGIHLKKYSVFNFKIFRELFSILNPFFIKYFWGEIT